MAHDVNQREIKLRDQPFIIGMRWSDIPTRPKNKDFIAAADVQNESTKHPVGVFILSESKATAVVGLATLQERISSKSRVFSLAASLAKTAKDGIYVAALDDVIWVVAVSDGIVVPGTDIVVTDSTFVASQVEFFHSMLPALDVYVDGFSINSPNEKAWKLVESLRVNVPVQLLVKSSALLILGVVGAIALIALGALAYSYLNKPEEVEEAVQVGVSEEQRRAEYFAGLQGQLENVLPVDRAWVNAAWSTINARYPAIRFGWTFEGAQCLPATCNMFFSTDTTGPRFADGLTASMNAGQSFSIGDNGSALSIPVSLPASFVVFDQSTIEGVPTSSAIRTAWRHLVEMASVRFPGMTFDIEPTETEPLEVIGSEGTPLTPEGAPRVVKGSMSVSGANLKDAPVVMRTAYIMGASPTSLTVAYGIGKSAKAWKMELTYVAQR